MNIRSEQPAAERSPPAASDLSEPLSETRRDGADSWFTRLVALVRGRSVPSIRADLEDALAQAGGEGGFSPQERAMLRNVLAFKTMRVADAMVPRADIIAVNVDITLGELLRVFRTAGHSRLPVYDETLDDPRGMIHIRDFLDYVAAQAEASATNRRQRRRIAVTEAELPSLGRVDLTQTLSAAKILRPVIFVPPSMPALDLLVKMQATRTHMALVIDEYGGTDGLVSIEDLVEMVVGDIEDEHDEEAGPAITTEAEGIFVADARIGLDEVSTVLGVDLAAGEAADEIDTLGGLIVTLAGRVPARGEIVAGSGDMEFEILDADPRRISRVRIHRRLTALEPRRRRARVRDETDEVSAEEQQQQSPPTIKDVP